MKNPVSACKFECQTIVLDGDIFKQCEFRKCQMVYAGGELPSFAHCNFVESAWRFEGPAERTLAFMSLFYHGMGEGGRAMIEKTFENVRKAPEKKAGT